MTTSISISPNYTTDDWRKLEFRSESDWDAAVKMLEDRIDGRFFEVIRRISDYDYAGFAILGLDCLLIETLEQFYNGTAQTPGGGGMKYFRNFLTRTSFKTHFTPGLAKVFYDSIRCGILHQAEVKGRSLVLRGKNAPLVKLAPGGRGLEINRNLFHRELVSVFGQYMSDLRTPANVDLRTNFQRKMNHICAAGAVC